jgi:hypothetical protein
MPFLGREMQARQPGRFEFVGQAGAIMTADVSLRWQSYGAGMRFR